MARITCGSNGSAPSVVAGHIAGSTTRSSWADFFIIGANSRLNKIIDLGRLP